MKKHRISLIALSAITLSACASGYYGPVYEPARSSSDSGYSEYRIDDNRFRVQYRIENGDLELAQDWALRRAAEVTLNQRYDWFQIISRNRTFRDDDFERYDRFRSYNDRYYERPRFDQRFDDDAVVIIEVIMGNNPPPRSASVYDARQVLDYTRGRTRY